MEYDLYSNDWDNIDLLLCEHMHGETLYFEQMSRWALQHGRAWGVVHIGPDDFQVHGSSSDYEIALRTCKAITRHGYIVNIDLRQPPITLQGSNKGGEDLVPVYLGVGVRKIATNTGASQTGALLDRPTLRWEYELSVEPASAYYDWIQVGRLRREGQRFIRDESFIPQSVHLKSYPALLRIALDITREAERALQALERATKQRSDGEKISPDWLSLMGVMTIALAPAAVLIDRDIHPRQYLQRLVTALRAYSSLLPLLEATNSNWTQVDARIRQVMRALETGATGEAGRTLDAGITLARGYAESEPPGANRGEFAPEEMRPGIFWWDSLELIRQAFIALAVLFDGLAPSLAGSTQLPADPGSVVKRNALPVKRIGF